MRFDRPQFELRRVQADGTYGPPKIVPVTELPLDTRTGRRGFFGVGMTATAVLLASGCQAPATRPPPTATPMPSTVTELAPPSPPVMAFDGGASALAFSPDGQQLAASGHTPYGSRGTALQVWQLADGRVRRITSDFGGPLSFSPDGTMLAFLHKGSVHLLQAADGAILRTFDGVSTTDSVFPTGSGARLAFSPDGQLLAAAGRTDIVDLWQVADGALLRTLRVTDRPIGLIKGSLAFSPDGQLLAVVGGISALWRVADGTRLKLPGDQGPLYGIAFSPDGQTLAMALRGSVRHYSVSDGNSPTLRATFPISKTAEERAAPYNYDHVFFTTDLEVAALRRGRHIRLWRVADPSIAYEIETESTVFSPDGSMVATSHGAAIALWDLFPPAFRGFLFDREARLVNPSSVLTYHAQHPASGQTITYTLPCARGVPAGATCVCNCVPTTDRVAPSPGPDRVLVPSGTSPGGGGQICTCVPVWIRR